MEEGEGEREELRSKRRSKLYYEAKLIGRAFSLYELGSCPSPSSSSAHLDPEFAAPGVVADLRVREQLAEEPAACMCMAMCIEEWSGGPNK